MVDIFLRSEWFLPSLSHITKVDFTVSPKCSWHLARRSSKASGKQLLRCSKVIPKSAVEQTNALIQELQSLLKSAVEDTEASAIFHKLKSLFLCGTHRSAENAQAIYEYWAGDLAVKSDHSAPAGPKPHASATLLSKNPLPLSDLQRTPNMQQPQPGGDVRCREQSTVVPCGNTPSSTAETRTRAATKAIRSDCRLSRTSSLPQSDILLKFEESKSVVPWNTPKNTKPISRTTSQTYLPNPTTPSSVSTNSQSTSYCRAPTGFVSPVPPAAKASSSDNKSNHIQSHIHTKNNQKFLVCPNMPSPSPMIQRTRSTTRMGAVASQSNDLVPLFEPLALIRSSRKAAENILQKIKASISVGEIKSGFIYGFKRPGCDLIKIGYTNQTTHQRMDDFVTKCKYKPHVVFEISTKHAMKVERLVHKHLYLFRRRECLLEGRCNSGRGCATKHAEWFEGISDSYAQSVVQNWVDWMDLQPYGDDNCLKREWVNTVKLFNYFVSGDIWMTWTKSFVKVENPNERESPKLGIKTESDTENAKDALTFLHAPKWEPRISICDIKDENDSFEVLEKPFSTVRYVEYVCA